MEFFKRIRSKLKIRNLIWAVVSLFVIGLFVFSIVLDIKSGNGHSVRLFSTKIGIPVWLEVFFWILVILFFVILFITSIKSFLRDTEYNELLKTAESFGSIEHLGETLSEISPSPYAKGELRCNSAYLFYRIGSDVYLIDTRSITAIDHKVHRNMKRTVSTYYVCVKTVTSEIKIKVKRRNIEKLENEIMQTIGKKLTPKSQSTEQ